MLDSRYPIDDVRQFLMEAGARMLSKTDEELPSVLACCPGENWLLPVNYQLASHIVINLGDTYPDDPPSFFLPKNLRNASLIPHVSKTGNICTLFPETAVNPYKPLEVLKECLATSKSLLDRTWDDESILAEIEPEFAAYWRYEATKSVVYFRPDLEQRILEISPCGNSKTNFSAKPADGGKLEQEAHLGIVIRFGKQDALGFLRTPESFLLGSEVFSNSVKALQEYIEPRNRVLKSIKLFLFLLFELENGACTLIGRMSNPVSAKKKNIQHFQNAVSACLKNSRIEPYLAEDISTKRLIHRTAGATIPESLFEKRVAIIGCGSLGSLVADSLARSGVRDYLFCDNGMFLPENLARHFLLSPALFSQKAFSLSAYIRMRLPDAKIQAIGHDIRTPDALSQLRIFNPDVILCATGDTNTDITVSEIVAEEKLGTCCFTWVEPNLETGHLIIQPRGSASILKQLHSVEGKEGRYCHALIESPEKFLMKESGCQSSFTPYSGLDMLLFAAHVSKKIISLLTAQEIAQEILRVKFNEHDHWDVLL